MVFGFGRRKHEPPPEIVRLADSYEPANHGVYQDMTAPLASYFVSSSHNTYLHGHQLVGKGGTDVITSCLLAGCRVVELDVYDEEQGPKKKGNLAGMGPQVRHGDALTSAVTFEECMVSVATHAFTSSPYPVICTFENHCDHDNESKMAAILRRVLGDKLLVPSPAKRSADGEGRPSKEALDEEEELAHASPESLRGKILIRCKVVSKAGEAIHPDLAALVYIANTKMKAMMESELPIDEQQGLSCSVEAGRLLDLQKTQDKVLLFTTRHILRIYPQTWRINSANYDPVPAWNMGAQVVALNWQKFDRAMALYQTKFLDNGGCGYVIKPSWAIAGVLPSKPPSPKVLTVRVLSAGIEHKKTFLRTNLDDLFVELEVVGLDEDAATRKTRVAGDCAEAHFDEPFSLHVHFPDMALLIVWLKDHDNHTVKDDCLGYYGIPLSNVRPGRWLLPLKGEDSGEELKDKDGRAKRWVTVDIGWSDEPSPAAGSAVAAADADAKPAPANCAAVGADATA